MITIYNKRKLSIFKPNHLIIARYEYKKMRNNEKNLKHFINCQFFDLATVQKIWKLQKLYVFPINSI